MAKKRFAIIAKFNKRTKKVEVDTEARWVEPMLMPTPDWHRDEHNTPDVHVLNAEREAKAYGRMHG